MIPDLCAPPNVVTSEMCLVLVGSVGACLISLVITSHCTALLPCPGYPGLVSAVLAIMLTISVLISVLGRGMSPGKGQEEAGGGHMSPVCPHVWGAVRGTGSEELGDAGQG